MGTRTRIRTFLRVVGTGVAGLGLLSGATWLWNGDRTPQDRSVTQLFAGLPWYQQFMLHPRMVPYVPKRLLNGAIRQDMTLDLDRVKAQSELSRLGTNAWPWVPRILNGIATDGSLRGGVFAAEVLVFIRADQSPEWSQSVQVLRERPEAAALMVHLINGRDRFMNRYDLEHRRWAVRRLGEVGLATPEAVAALKAILATPEDRMVWTETMRPSASR